MYKIDSRKPASYKAASYNGVRPTDAKSFRKVWDNPAVIADALACFDGLVERIDGATLGQPRRIDDAIRIDITQSVARIELPSITFDAAA